jgi:Leucine-rich repeat (LRR) protein
MTNLQRLFLASTNLIGTIPDAIGSFANLAKVNLSNNTLTGTIPTGFGSLDKLGKWTIFPF